MPQTPDGSLQLRTSANQANGVEHIGTVQTVLFIEMVFGHQRAEGALKSLKRIDILVYTHAILERTVLVPPVVQFRRRRLPPLNAWRMNIWLNR